MRCGEIDRTREHQRHAAITVIGLRLFFRGVQKAQIWPVSRIITVRDVDSAISLYNQIFRYPRSNCKNDSPPSRKFPTFGLQHTRFSLLYMMTLQ